jgi:DNA (cytosine-5)-methyltransferase 1
MLTFGSLFSGIGGFELGFENAGMHCLWQCEIDKACLEVLEKHWPDTRRYEDVRTIGKGNLEAVDIICGGFPCQDLSIAGRREGLSGERSGLWSEYARVIDEMGPKWVVIENVRGLLSSDGGRDFASIIQWLVKRGYCVSWRILDSEYFGVPQRRHRVFIVASFGNECSTKVLFEQGSLYGHDKKVYKFPPQDTRSPFTEFEIGSGNLIPRTSGTLSTSLHGLDIYANLLIPSTSTC